MDGASQDRKMGPQFGRFVVRLLVVSLLALCGGAGVGAQDQEIDGTLLYQKVCANCHGKTGDGRGIAARYLFPKARNLRHDQFRLVSTVSHNPSRDDIYRVLENGIPGSSMQSWKSLGEEKLRALVDRVLQIRKEGAVERIQEELREAGDVGPGEEQRLIDEYVARLMAPGETWKGMGIVPTDDDSVDLGGQMYLRQQCASCHGKEGRGSPGMDLVDQRGNATWATDLVQDRLHGGSRANDIARRIFLGMPGSAMPSSKNLNDEELAALVAYCMSLSAEPKRDLTNHQRRERAIGRIPVKKGDKSP